MSGERELSVAEALAYARGKAKRGLPESALRVLDQVVRATPGHVPAIMETARVLQQVNRFDEAVGLLRRAATLTPGAGRVLFNLANGLRNWGDSAAAIAFFRRSLRLKGSIAEMHVGLALALMQVGAWEEGFAEYEWRRSKQEFTQWMAEAGRAPWDGGDVAGKTILLLSEQGLGDTLHFVRYAVQLAERGAVVHVHGQPPLRRLLASMPQIASVVTSRVEAFDTAELLMSLPLRFGTRPDSVPAMPPYLRPVGEPPVTLPRTGRLRVGLVWQGNPAHARDRWRSIPFAALAPLLDVGGVDFYSLQKGAATVEHPRLTNLGPALGDFADTAAVIAQLDLVIAVDTSVAHVTGALGKPLWLLLARNADWRWLEGRDDTPWYASAHLFRQPALGEWAPVIARVAERLAATV